MNAFKKAILVGSSVLAIAFAANSVLAHGDCHGHGKGHAKVWKDQGPQIVVNADPSNFSYTMSLKYFLKSNATHKPVKIDVDQTGVANALSQLQTVGTGNVLIIKELSFKDANGKKLENCNMIKNSAFVSGASSVSITVSANGCTLQ